MLRCSICVAGEGGWGATRRNSEAAREEFALQETPPLGETLFWRWS